MINYKNNYKVSKNGSYLMNAAIGGIHNDVADEMQKWTRLTSQLGAINDIRFFNLIEDARTCAARFVNVDKEDIAFSASTSLNMNYFALMMKESGIHTIVTPEVEFPSSTLAWFHHGYEVELIKQRDGQIWEDELIEKSRKPGHAVVLSAVQFLTGQRMNLIHLSRELALNNTPFFINGTQLIGQFPIDLKNLIYTGFTASLHKWLGADLGLSLISMPKFEREKVNWPVAGWTSVEDPWSLENKKPEFVKQMSALQLGTMPFNLVAGAKRAMEVQIEIGQEKISTLIEKNSTKLSEIIKNKGFKLLSPRELGVQRSGICSFVYDNNLEEALSKLAGEKVFVNGRKECIRASIHYYNDEEDLDLFEKAIELI